MPWPPTRIRQRASSPTACQKVMSRHPNSVGASQFHRCMTSSPPIQMKSGIASIAAGTIKNHFFLLILGSSLTRIISSNRFFGSFLGKFVVNALQSFAELKHRVALAREQRVDADAT